MHTRRRQRNPSNLFAFLLQQQRSRWEALPHAEKYKKIYRVKKNQEENSNKCLLSIFELSFMHTRSHTQTNTHAHPHSHTQLVAALGRGKRKRSGKHYGLGTPAASQRRDNGNSQWRRQLSSQAQVRAQHLAYLIGIFLKKYAYV